MPKKSAYQSRNAAPRRVLGRAALKRLRVAGIGAEVIGVSVSSAPSQRRAVEIAPTLGKEMPGRRAQIESSRAAAACETGAHLNRREVVSRYAPESRAHAQNPMQNHGNRAAEVDRSGFEARSASQWQKSPRARAKSKRVYKYL